MPVSPFLAAEKEVHPCSSSTSHGALSSHPWYVLSLWWDIISENDWLSPQAQLLKVGPGEFTPGWGIVLPPNIAWSWFSCYPGISPFLVRNTRHNTDMLKLCATASTYDAHGQSTCGRRRLPCPLWGYFCGTYFNSLMVLLFRVPGQFGSWQVYQINFIQMFGLEFSQASGATTCFFQRVPVPFHRWRPSRVANRLDDIVARKETLRTCVI